MKRTLTDFLGKELHFEHLRSIYRYFMRVGGYDRSTMVEELSEHLASSEGAEQLAEEITDQEVELLYVLRQVGGIAPRRWLFRELAARSELSAEQWKRVFWRLRRRHITYLIGSDTAYLPEGISDVIGARISGEPQTPRQDIVPGASTMRQAVHGFVVALLNYVHQNPPRVMAEGERIWKRDLEGMGDFFHSYLLESGAGEGSLGLVRGRINRLVELLRKMGFFEKRGKKLYVDPENWNDWATRPEVERQSFFLSFLKDHYENIPLALEALVDWKGAAWIPISRLTEAVRYRTLRSAFHVLRVRPQAEVSAKEPGRRWVSACVYLLADLGLVYTGSDADGEPVARPTDGAIQAWRVLHGAKPKRRRSQKAVEGLRVYAQPNFELLVPEECPPVLHRRIGAIAELRSLDRFWTYVLTPNSVARGVEEGFAREEVLGLLDEIVQEELPPNVCAAVASWSDTAWWVDADGSGTFLSAERTLLDSIRKIDGVEEHFEFENGWLHPTSARELAARWLEEQGIRVAAEDRDPPNELGRSAREDYVRAIEAWKRRLEHSGEGTPAGSYWDDVVPVEPLPDSPGPRG